MSPAFPMSYAKNGFPGDAETRRIVGHFGRGGAYFENLCHGQYRAPAFFSPCDAPSPFANHVINIVPLSTNEEMSGVDAPSVIAGMANEHSGGDGASMQFPRQPMNKALFAAPTKRSISVWIDVSAPIPAIVRATQYLSVMIQSLFKRPLRWNGGASFGCHVGDIGILHPYCKMEYVL